MKRGCVGVGVGVGVSVWVGMRRWWRVVGLGTVVMLGGRRIGFRGGRIG